MTDKVVMDKTAAAAVLQGVCIELGYDESNAKRKELIALLEGCEGSKEFPKDIMGLVCAKMGKKEHEVVDELRKQVADVVHSIKEPAADLDMASDKNTVVDEIDAQ